MTEDELDAVMIEKFERLLSAWERTAAALERNNELCSQLLLANTTLINAITLDDNVEVVQPQKVRSMDDPPDA